MCVSSLRNSRAQERADGIFLLEIMDSFRLGSALVSVPAMLSPAASSCDV